MRERSLLAAVIMIASKTTSAPFSQVGSVNAGGGEGGGIFIWSLLPLLLVCLFFLVEIKEEKLASVIAERILIEPQT